MYFIPINIFAVIIAAVVAQIIGFIWYSPGVFGKQWMALVGMNEADAGGEKKGMAKLFVYSFLASLVTGYILGTLISNLVVASIVDGAKLAFFLWLGFMAPLTLSDILFSAKKKSSKLFFINGGYWLVTLVIMGVILALWV